VAQPKKGFKCFKGSDPGPMDTFHAVFVRCTVEGIQNPTSDSNIIFINKQKVLDRYIFVGVKIVLRKMDTDQCF